MSLETERYMTLVKEFGLLTGYLYRKSVEGRLDAYDIATARRRTDEDSTVIRVVAGAIEPFDMKAVMGEVFRAAAFDGRWEYKP